MRSRVAVFLLAGVIPLSRVLAQGYPIHQDTSRGHSREVIFLHRALAATAANTAILVPTITAYRASGSERWLIGGAVAQLAVTSYVASMARGSQRCGRGRRLWLALGGAIIGAGGAVLMAEPELQERHAHEHPALTRPVTLASLALGVPLGAAAGLYNCS